MPANVQNVESILSTISEIMEVASNTSTVANDAQSKAQKVNNEAEREEKNSKQKLEQAKQEEKAAKQAHEVAKATVLAAEGYLASLIAGLPTTAPALPGAYKKIEMAKKAERSTYKIYQAAQAYRKIMEARYDMAKVCRMRAAAMLAKLTGECVRHVPKVADLTNSAVSRLKSAKDDLDNFHSHIASGINISVPQNTRTFSDAHDSTSKNKKKNSFESSDDRRYIDSQKQMEAYLKWRDYRETGDIVRPDKIHDRLNPPDDVRMGMLRERYENNLRFRQQVDDFRQKLASGDPQQIEYVRRQSKKNMAGQLSEDIIKDALAPLADSTSTQVQQVLEDGGYTKIDLVFEGMKQPTVFGKGQGMMAPKGGSVAIEVKSGQDEYLLAQKPHLDRQVQGHRDYDVSLILCTRDIKDLSAEQEYRGGIRESGSRIIGMLPRKDEINDVVWRFLNEGVDVK